MKNVDIVFQLQTKCLFNVNKNKTLANNKGFWNILISILILVSSDHGKPKLTPNLIQMQVPMPIAL